MLTILMDSCLTKTGLDLSLDKEASLPPRVPLEREFIPLNQCLAHWINQFVYHHHFVICSVENLKKKKGNAQACHSNYTHQHLRKILKIFPVYKQMAIVLLSFEFKNLLLVFFAR